jgi:hypothetical protein
MASERDGLWGSAEALSASRTSGRRARFAQSLVIADQLDHHFGPEAARHHHRLDATVGDGLASMAVVYASFMSAVMLRSSSRKVWPTSVSLSRGSAGPMKIARCVHASITWTVL